MAWATALTGYCMQIYAAARMVKLSMVIELGLWCLFLIACFINNVFVLGATVVWEASVALATIFMYLVGSLEVAGHP